MLNRDTDSMCTNEFTKQSFGFLALPSYFNTASARIVLSRDEMHGPHSICTVDQIAMIHRTDNAVKNRFNSTLRKRAALGASHWLRNSDQNASSTISAAVNGAAEIVFNMAKAVVPGTSVSPFIAPQMNCKPPRNTVYSYTVMAQRESL